MKKFALIFILPFLLGGVIEIAPALPDISSSAEAARLGGGRSLGSKPSLNRSAPAPTPRQGTQQAAPGGAASPARGGFLGGMLGPILAGSLIGALFFGGAFSGLGMIDIVMIGLLIWLAMRLLRGRAASTQQSAHTGSGQAQGYGPGSRDYSGAWAHLAGDKAQASAPQSHASPGFVPPPGFDREKFMEGARLMYTRMQEAWDRRDLEDIRQFTTPGMFRLIEEQAKDDPEPSTTTILTMQAAPHGFKREGSEEMISVYFDVLLREYADRDAENAREIWHFARPASGGTWKLDGIQQVE